MPNDKGQIRKGEHLSRATEFKRGQHWREKKPFWDREWLFDEYINKQRSAAEIAAQFGVGATAILFWLEKLNIPRRTTKEARSIKHWGVSGELNGMFGRRGDQNPRWLGGVTPERQALYSSREWAKVVRLIWRRDKETCQRCRRHHAQAGKMHIHHIVSFSIAELRCEPTNLILLCEDCHHWVHSKENVDHAFIQEV